MAGLLDDVSRAIGRFDGAIDERVDRLRGHPHVDRLMYAATELGDFTPSGSPPSWARNRRW
jgi:hypothetical protein